MPLDLNVNLPETAKALSEPVTKLIEVVAAGCGKLYEPTGIRRKARAEGDTLVIREEALGRSELARRAAQRLLDVEERRQENIESIAAQARDLLPNEVSPTPVHRDWAARFFEECKDVSDEEMRTVWAKLLAGEITEPGSFSQRTLSVLKNISHEEATLFNTLCANSLRGLPPRTVYPFVGAYSGLPFWNRLGLNFEALQRLQETGLITNQVIGELHQAPAPSMFVVRARSATYAITPRSPGPGSSLIFGTVDLTAAGKDLSEVCEFNIPEERWADLERGLSTNFAVEQVLAEPIPGRKEWAITRQAGGPATVS